MNATFRALMPKDEDSMGLPKFRPISLVGSLYKTFSKELANRVREVIGSIITPSFQGAFSFVNNE